MFADDINLFFSDNCYNQLFRVANEELTHVDHWLTANKLSLNISKTNYIVFRILNSKLPSNLPSLKLRRPNNILKRVSNVTFLGIAVHEYLSWKPHMEVGLLLQKIRLTTSVVNKIKSLLNKQILFTLYNSLIKSHIQYCILIWCNEIRQWCKDRGGGGGGASSQLFFQTPLSPYLNYAMSLYHHKNTKNFATYLKKPLFK